MQSVPGPMERRIAGVLISLAGYLLAELTTRHSTRVAPGQFVPSACASTRPTRSLIAILSRLINDVAGVLYFVRLIISAMFVPCMLLVSKNIARLASWPDVVKDDWTRPSLHCLICLKLSFSVFVLCFSLEPLSLCSFMFSVFCLLVNYSC